jgi:hypothetical protein
VRCMALAARPGQVVRQVFAGGRGIVLIGVAAGLAGTLWATNLLRRLLFNVDSHDPARGIRRSVASQRRARRAAAVDPLTALHFE